MATLPQDAIFLGFDSSTQSLKVTALDSKLRIIATESVNFDSVLPHFQTEGGVHRHGEEGRRVTAPPLMWVEASETLLNKLKESKFPFERVSALSGSGQQHGSVYWRKGSKRLLNNLQSNNTLVGQLQNAFTVDSPIWMDSSTTPQCQSIENAIGGPLALASLTGSRAYERFTGPQIRKIYEDSPELYQMTERISLVSSFGASIFIGDYAAIDHSDAAGMNLMDLKKRDWSPAALSATAPHLLEKLGRLSPPHSVAGTIHPFFIEKYGFKPECLVIHWSGDNLCSLAGLGMENAGDLAISLGTSDTVFAVVSEPKPSLEGNLFPNPVDPSTYMAMLVYKNASLVREEIRNNHAASSWEVFNSFLHSTPPLNGGRMGFYFSFPEITPPVSVGFHRFLVSSTYENFENYSKCGNFSPEVEVRALVEGQMVSMRAHAERVGLVSPPDRIIMTGGGSANQSILRIASDVFGCNVYTAQRTDSASLGAALRAAHGWMCHHHDDDHDHPHHHHEDDAVNRPFVPFSHLLRLAGERSAVQLELAEQQAGDATLHSQYAQMAKCRMHLEKQIVKPLTTVTSDSIPLSLI